MPNRSVSRKVKARSKQAQRRKSRQSKSKR